MIAAVGTRQSLGGFVGFEAEVALLEFSGGGGLVEACVAEHQVVVGFEIFGIDGERGLEFGDGVYVAALEEEDAAEVVVDDAVARVLLDYFAEMARGFVVLAFAAEDARIEIVGAGEIRLEREGAIENFSGRGQIAFLYADAAQIDPAVGILRIDLRDFRERCGGAGEIAL